jgi:diadenosine tetraphosphate (Ap4A) HIT family hydrolase
MWGSNAGSQVRSGVRQQDGLTRPPIRLEAVLAPKQIGTGPATRWLDRWYIYGLSACLYCASPDDAWILTDEVVAVPHHSPLASCHVVVAPRRHVAAFYDLDVGEQRQIWDVLAELRKRIAVSLQVEGFDVGFVDGEHDDPHAHAYVHVIPRIVGDNVELPRGVEWVDLDA